MPKARLLFAWSSVALIGLGAASIARLDPWWAVSVIVVTAVLKVILEKFETF